MKRWIHATTDDDNNYVRKTRRNEIQFDHDTVWSIQFYNRSSDLCYQKEVHVLAKSYDEASHKADVLAECFGYPADAAVVQYAYKGIPYWDNLKIEQCEGVEYGVRQPL